MGANLALVEQIEGNILADAMHTTELDHSLLSRAHDFLQFAELSIRFDITNLFESFVPEMWNLLELCVRVFSRRPGQQ